MKTRILSTLAFSIAILAGAAARDEQGKTNGLAAKGPEVKKSVERLTTQIAWKTELQAALAQARTEGKLVFWMQMLGELEGVT